jgi:uncharacterized protein YgiM (DUF1202 family)
MDANNETPQQERTFLEQPLETLTTLAQLEEYEHRLLESTDAVRVQVAAADDDKNKAENSSQAQKQRKRNLVENGLKSLCDESISNLSVLDKAQRAIPIEHVSGLQFHD